VTFQALFQVPEREQVSLIASSHERTQIPYNVANISQIKSYLFVDIFPSLKNTQFLWDFYRYVLTCFKNAGTIWLAVHEETTTTTLTITYSLLIICNKSNILYF
jgi:hypothetical protein